VGLTPKAITQTGALTVARTTSSFTASTPTKNVNDQQREQRIHGSAVCVGR